MRQAMIAALMISLLAACAVRLGGPSPAPFRVVVLSSAETDAAAVAAAIREQNGQIALVTADRDSAWFAEVASGAGLELSGPGHTGPHSMAFLTSQLKLLGDTSIVLLVPSGGRIHMHDALYEIAENRQIDLMMVDVDGVQDVRDGVRTLLMYIASDVGNSVPLVLGVSARTTQVDDSVAVLLRAAFASAKDCAAADGSSGDGASASIAVAGLALLYGPPARLQCEDARMTGNGQGISARLVVGR